MLATVIVCVAQSYIFFCYGKLCGEWCSLKTAIRYILIASIGLAGFVFIAYGQGLPSSYPDRLPSLDEVEAQQAFEALPASVKHRQRLVATGRVLFFGAVPAFAGFALERRRAPYPGSTGI